MWAGFSASRLSAASSGVVKESVWPVLNVSESSSNHVCVEEGLPIPNTELFSRWTCEIYPVVL